MNRERLLKDLEEIASLWDDLDGARLRISVVEKQAKDAMDERDQLIRVCDELAEASKTVIQAFDGGIFVRNTENDSKPEWATKLLPYIAALGSLQKLNKDYNNLAHRGEK